MYRVSLTPFSYIDVGVHKAMVDTWGHDFHKKVLFCAGSAGTLFAIGIALGKTPEYMDYLYQKVAEKAKIYGSFYYGSLFMEEAIREMISDPMDYKLLEGRLCFSTTTFFSKHRWHVSWVDNEDLIATAKASCHIPFYCQKNSGVKGTIVIDGAYSFAGTDLPHGDDTLYVGIDPHAEITRSFTNNEMLTASVGKEYQDIVQSGYDAFMEWNGNMNKKVGHRQPNYQALYILWFLKLFEFIVDIFIWLFEMIVTLCKKVLAKALC